MFLKNTWLPTVFMLQVILLTILFIIIFLSHDLQDNYRSHYFIYTYTPHPQMAFTAQY